MINQKISFYLKIFVIFAVAIFISQSSINNIFLANSPKIRPNLGSYLAFKFKNTTANLLAKITINFPSFPKRQDSEIATSQPITEHKTMNFLKEALKPVAKGVSAASKDNYSYTFYDMDEVEWVPISYTLKDGRVINIEYAKGTEPPPKEIYEE